jgi:myo-inositol-1-phosphate synthase
MATEEFNAWKEYLEQRKADIQTFEQEKEARQSVDLEESLTETYYHYSHVPDPKTMGLLAEFFDR